MAGLGAVALAAVAGYLAAGAASATAQWGGAAKSRALAPTTGTATTTTGATSATTTTGATTTGTTTPGAATTTTGTTTTGTTTTGTTTTGTTTTGTTTTGATTTSTGTTTTATTRTTTRPKTKQLSAGKPASANEQTPAWIQTVTVTVPATTVTPSSSDPSDTTSVFSASVADADADPLSTTVGVDSSTLLAQTELTDSVLDSDPPKDLLPIFKAAGSAFDVPWQILAAINAVETDYGHDEHTSSAGAEGWMQFEPATFAKYAIATGDGSKASPYNATDAIFAAAHLLSANGAATNLRKAIFAYNHADWYVDEVTFLAASIVGAETPKSATATSKIAAMDDAAQVLDGTPYLWGGGHGGWTAAAAGYDCSGFVSAVLHAAGYLSEPQTTQTLPTATGMKSGPGRYVTIFDRTDSSEGITDDHVIIDIDGQWWESGGGSDEGGADDVHRITDLSAAYLASFNLELHPAGL